MNNIIFLGHLGLGDHIIQQGIVNYLRQSFDTVTIFCKAHNLLNVHHICQNNQINIIPVLHDKHVFAMMDNVYCGHPTVCTGIYRDKNFSSNIHFDKYIYSQANIPFEESYNWTVSNGKHPAPIPDEPFCFIHDKPDKHEIVYKNLPTDIKIVRPYMSHLIFDFLPMLRKAQEIHCMDSSFALMIDRAQNITCKKYIHRYIRPSIYPCYKSDWEIIL